MVRFSMPMNVLQAALAMQMAVDQIWASRWSQVVSASVAQLGAMIRAGRQGQVLKRGAAMAERRLERQRALMEKLGETAEPAGAWDYDLAELEAIEWPRYHPRDLVTLGWRPDPDPEPKKPYKYWGDVTKQERLERH